MALAEAVTVVRAPGSPVPASQDRCDSLAATCDRWSRRSSATTARGSSSSECSSDGEALNLSDLGPEQEAEESAEEPLLDAAVLPEPLRAAEQPEQPEVRLDFGGGFCAVAEATLGPGAEPQLPLHTGATLALAPSSGKGPAFLLPSKRTWWACRRRARPPASLLLGRRASVGTGEGVAATVQEQPIQLWRLPGPRLQTPGPLLCGRKVYQVTPGGTDVALAKVLGRPRQALVGLADRAWALLGSQLSLCPRRRGAEGLEHLKMVDERA